MKTPREILLAHHRVAEPKLDAIRHSAVAAVCDRRTTTGHVREQRSQTAATMIETFWRELILPSRRIWTVLAAVWLVIAAVNLAERDHSSAGKITSAPVMMSLREQQRWMNELFADRSLPIDTEPPKTFAPKPRTELMEKAETV